MAFAPDGRLFICEQTGALKVFPVGQATGTTALQLNVYPNGECGLLGIAFDPNFASNRFLYLYYTAHNGSYIPSAGLSNRVSRFVVNGNVVDHTSEVVILGGILVSGGNHNGGCIRFGADGKLYIATGDAGDSANSQDLLKLNGKILRINADGSIPSDNPFVGQAGRRPEIFCYGLRNPFKFNFRPGTSTLFIGDVGPSNWEEINVSARGGNYGWPLYVGPNTAPGYIGPVYTYETGPSNGTVIAGVFLTSASFPDQYRGDFFYGDFMRGECHRLDVSASNTVQGSTRFGPSEGLGDIAEFVVEIAQGPDGALYLLSYSRGDVTRVFFQ